MILSSILAAVGKTPLVDIKRFCEAEGVDARLLCKVEFTNPGGSVKDRAALNMIRAAEESGQLHPGGTIIESTSGNTGVGLAMVGAVLGYRVILTMPESMSIERRKLLSAYGATVILTPAADGMAGANAKAREILKSTPNSIMASQFENPENPGAHVLSTGPEILEDAGKGIDAFVACVGSGGTLTGVGGYLKKAIPGLSVFAVEPAESPLLSGGRPGAHGIEGIGANFVPGVLDTSLFDEVLTVKTDDAILTARKLARCEGLLCGISSGAAVSAAAALAKRNAWRGKTIVTVLPDTGERYLSTKLFQ